MSKFGNKYTCWSCATKFYDLGKADPKCPKCGAKPGDDPNKGMPVAAAPAAIDEYDDVEEPIDEEVADEEEAEEEADETPPAEDEY